MPCKRSSKDKQERLRIQNLMKFHHRWMMEIFTRHPKLFSMLRRIYASDGANLNFNGRHILQKRVPFSVYEKTRSKNFPGQRYKTNDN